jgi:predicted Ser/Thr protein kinase
MANGTAECVHCHTPLPDNSRYCFACGADVSGGAGPASTGNVEVLQQRLQRLVEGKYEIIRMLGKGGMGAVFLAHDLTLEREVAIKVLPPDVAQDEQVVRRFQQEAKTAAKLDHPNIIPIYRVESEGGLNYFVMKYVSGTSLEDVLERRQPLSIDYVQRVVWEAGCALGHAHQRGVVHRDVKPANIIFDHDGRVTLTDFGISKALQAATGFTATGMIIGTPHYMAPEQAKGGSVDGRADQYSLGIVGYRLLTGELPFGGDSVHTILYKHIFEEVPLATTRRADVPAFLSTALARALAKEPEHRFPTMEEFATAVWPEQPVAAPARAAAARAPKARRVGTADAPTEMTSAPTTPIPAAATRAARPKPATRPAPSAARAPRKSRAGLVAVVVVLGALGAGGYVLLGRSQPEAPPGAPVTPLVETVHEAAPAPDRAKPAAPAPSPSRRTERPPAQAAQGYLTIAADPYGTVYIDGVQIGVTPVFSYGVKAGSHAIRVERAGYRTQSETVQVDAGNTVTKRYTLMEQP